MTTYADEPNVVKLNARSLNSLPSAVRVPHYDRTQLSDAIVHIGVGGFHRAHQALYMDELMEKGLARDWGICGVGLLPRDARMRDALRSQDYLYTLVEKSPDGDRPRIIGSLTGYLFAPEDRETVLEKMASPATRIVSLTITEGGYYFDAATGEFDAAHPDIVHDLENPGSPICVYGFLAEALNRRRQRGLSPFTVMSCDNIQSNGEMARTMLLAFAGRRDSQLASWIERHGAFPNSMVDRITPATADTDRAGLAEQFGIEDAWPVVTEPFVQWVMEDRFCNGRPPFEQAGVQMTDDVHPYEMMKIRLLNASHSSLAYLAYLAGITYVHEVMQDPKFNAFVFDLMNSEVTPVVPPVPGIDLDQYKRTLIERFANPAVRDQVARLCLDGSAKLPKFILPTIVEQLQRGGEIKRLCLGIAGWFRYLAGKDEQGRPIEINDPMGERLRSIAESAGDDPMPLLGVREIFGQDLPRNERFVELIRGPLQSLYAQGARATMDQYL